MAETVLPILFKKTDSIDVNLRHGSIISIGEVAISLSELEKQNGKFGAYLNESLIDQLNGLVIKLQKRDLFRGNDKNQICQMQIKIEFHFRLKWRHNESSLL